MTVGAWTSRYLSSTTLTLQMGICTVAPPRKLVESCLNVCAEPHAFLVVSTDLTEPFWHALPYSTAADRCGSSAPGRVLDRFGSAWARQG